MHEEKCFGTSFILRCHVIGFRPRTNKLNYVGQVASQNQAAGAQRNRPWHKLHFKVSQDRVPSMDKRVQLCGSSGVSKLGDGCTKKKALAQASF